MLINVSLPYDSDLPISLITQINELVDISETLLFAIPYIKSEYDLYVSCIDVYYVGGDYFNRYSPDYCGFIRKSAIQYLIDDEKNNTLPIKNMVIDFKR